MHFVWRQNIRTFVLWLLHSITFSLLRYTLLCIFAFLSHSFLFIPSVSRYTYMYMYMRLCQTQSWLFNYLIPSNWDFYETPHSIVRNSQQMHIAFSWICPSLNMCVPLWWLPPLYTSLALPFCQSCSLSQSSMSNYEPAKRTNQPKQKSCMHVRLCVYVHVHVCDCVNVYTLK